jgi:hypothetical protein
MSRSDLQHAPRRSGGGVKAGEQAKCRIIMRLNKLRVGREEFTKSVETHLENIDYFYRSLAACLEQQRLADRQEVLRAKGLVRIS